MEKTEIILIRHGESLGNAKNLYLGRTDLDLSERGYRQAELAAQSLSSVKIDKVYSSPLKRAYNTAVPHARKRGLEVVVHEGLVEIYIGKWENISVDVLMTDWRDEFIHGWRESFGTYTPPGGESVQAVANRVYNAVVEIAKNNIGKTVLIASHAAAIRSFYGKVLGLAPECLAEALPFPTNASFTKVTFDGEKLIPVVYSDDSHLSDLTEVVT